MGLRLPDSRVLEYADVLSAIHEYRVTYPAATPPFDQTNSGPRNEITAIDLLALNAFGGRARPMTAMTSMRQMRHQVTRDITAKAIAPLENLTEQQTERELPAINRVIGQIDSVRGFGDTATSQLFHRLRPNVGAIRDSRVGRWYPPNGDRAGSWIPWLRQVYSQVRESRECLQAVQRSMETPLALLRIWDIVLWQLDPTPES